MKLNEPQKFGTFRGADIYTGEMVFGWLRQTPKSWIIYNTGDSLEPGLCKQASVHPQSIAMFTGIYTTEYAKFIPTEKFKKISKDNQIGKATLEMREFYKGFHPTHNHGKPIFLSFPLPDGTMSKGGDILRDLKGSPNVGEAMIDPTHPCGEKGPFVNWLIKDDGEGYSPDTWFGGEIIGNAYENPELLYLRKHMEEKV